MHQKGAWPCALFVALAAAFLGCAEAVNDVELFREVYVWRRLDFVWPDDTTKAHALTTKLFQPENCVIQGIRVWRDRLYLTLLRSKPGVPATLVSIPATASPNVSSPLLEPFPSWDMQMINNCSALQFVTSIEIDTNGRLWVLDAGRMSPLDYSPSQCSPKLVVFNLENDGNVNTPTNKIVNTFIIPDSVLSRYDSFTVDMVIDTDSVVYISDNSDSDPGIIVFDTKNGHVWKIRDPVSMTADPNFRAVVGGRGLNIHSNINSLALSPVPSTDVHDRNMAQPSNTNRILYYSPLSSYQLYSINTSILKNEELSTRHGISNFVTSHGNKTSFSQDMIMDTRNTLYIALNTEDAIARWDTMKTPLEQNIHVIAKDSERLQWPSSFAFDMTGSLWVISNRLQNVLTNTVNVEETNYRIMKAYTGSNSYLYIQDTTMQSTEMQPSTTTDYTYHLYNTVSTNNTNYKMNNATKMSDNATASSSVLYPDVYIIFVISSLFVNYRVA